MLFEMCPLLTNHVVTSKDDPNTISSINCLMVAAPISIFKITTSLASLNFKAFSDHENEDLLYALSNVG